MDVWLAFLLRLAFIGAAHLYTGNMDPRWKHPTLAFVLLLGWCSYSMAAKEGTLTKGDYPYEAKLDDNYRMSWNFNSTHIIFHIEAKTQGWVGFGLSERGSMIPGDIVIGWMDGNDDVHFHDRHAKSKSRPIIDAQQDWHLLEFSRQDGEHYSFTVVRKMNTCDPEGDIAIERGTARIIYAYSTAVPSSDDDILYHGTFRGTKSILLLNPPPLEGGGKNLPADVTTHDFVNQNYPVPSKPTTYSCYITKFEVVGGKHHMIRVEPMIQEGHENLVHHMILYYCNRPISDEHLNSPYECYGGNETTSKLDDACSVVLTAWAVGGSAFDYPAHVGISLGSPKDPTYFRLEIHYDNYLNKTDYVDSSGVRAYLTQELRTYDAGIIDTGMAVSPYQVIPPGYEAFRSRGYCDAECFQRDTVMETEGIKVFANFVHSHLIGRKMATRHIRNGKELPPISEDNHYDFNYQEGRLLPEERVIKKGDVIFTDCIYDSTGRSTLTMGGLSSNEEMCLSFLMYYPKIDLSLCGTVLTYRKNGISDIYGVDLSRVDWNMKENRDMFAGVVQESDVMNYCQYAHSDGKEWLQVARPTEFKSFETTDVCSEGSPAGRLASNLYVNIVFLVGVLLQKYSGM